MVGLLQIKREYLLQTPHKHRIMYFFKASIYQLINHEVFLYPSTEKNQRLNNKFKISPNFFCFLR